VRNETEVAMDLYNALVGFFELHPQYQQNDFYIFGESYAGKYVPALAWWFTQQSSPIVHLAGVGIGDGDVDPYYQVGSYAPLLYYYGLIGEPAVLAADAVYDTFTAAVDAGLWDVANTIDNMLLESLAGNIDVYDVRVQSQNDPTNAPTAHLTNYLGRADVRQALYVTKQSARWGECDTAPYFALSEDMAQTTISYVVSILQTMPVLLYNGAFDLICNFIGTKYWSDAMQWPGSQAFLAAPNTTWSPSGYQGYYQSAAGLTRLVVINAGHMVPARGENPVGAYYLFTDFVGGFWQGK